MPPPAYAQTYGSPFDQERQKQINRTRTGVLLILIGTLISWIPFVGALGGLLVFIGAILVILGRKAFGAAHSRNVILSIVLVFLGILIGIIGGVIAFASTFASFGQAAPTPAAISSAINSFLIVGVIAGLVTGLANVFFTFAIQNQTGKRLLLAGYAAGVVVSIVVLVVASGVISELVAAACPGGTCSQTASLTLQDSVQNRLLLVKLLQVIPALLYGGAYYLVWNRIKSGEIPGPSMPPGMMPPPAAPMPPR
jgi:hypothetical protein